MEKNKIITSLTLAGILTAGVLGGNANAASNKSLGVCKDLIRGESIVPYVFDSTADKLVAEAIKGEYRITSQNFTDSTQIRTGDKFETAKGSKTVLVYGDVNKDGIVDTFDASATQQIYLGRSASDLEKLAANVINDTNVIDTFDASRIQQFYLGNTNLVLNLPKGESEEYNDEYEMAIDEGKGINNQNYAEATKATPDLAKAIKLTITPKTEFVENDGLKVIARKLVDEEKGEYAQGTAGASGVTDVYDITPIGGITVHSNEKNKTMALDFTSIFTGATPETANGTYKIELVRTSNSKVVAETTVTTHYLATTTTKLDANVFINRQESYNARVGLLGFGDEAADRSIEKIYLSIGTSYTDGADIKENGIPVAVTNNEITVTKQFTDTSHTVDGQTTVQYVLEDSYGNLINLDSITLPDDDNAKVALAEIESFEVTKNNQFTITTKEPFTGSIIAVLYENGKPIATETLTYGTAAAGSTPATTSESETTASFAAKMTKPTTYTVKAYVDGGANGNQPSIVYSSADTKVSVSKTQLPAVVADSIKYDLQTNKLTWDYQENDDISITVSPVTSSVVGSSVATVTAPATLPSSKDENERTVTFASTYTDPSTSKVSTKVYQVSIVASNTADANVIASKPTIKELFRLSLANTANIDYDPTETSFKLTGITPISLVDLDNKEIENPDIKYRVEVWDYTDGDEHTERNRILNPTVQLTQTKGASTYETPIIGGKLAEGTDYSVKVFAKYNGVESQVYTTSITTATSLNELDVDCEVDNTITRAKDSVGKIGTNGTDVFVNGKKLAVTDYTAANKKILTEVVANLLKGDRVKVQDNKVTITVNTPQKDTMNLGDLSELDVKVIGNGTIRTINGTDTSGLTGTPNYYKDTTLTLEGGNFIIGDYLLDTVGDNNIVLNGTNIVDANGKIFDLAVGKVNTVEGIEYTATNSVAEVNFATANAPIITAGTSNVTITNKTTSPLIVELAHDSTYAKDQSGKLTISSPTNVTLNTNNVDITEQGGLDVTLKGILTLGASSSSIRGAINVNVEGIKAVAVTAPNGAVVDLTGATLTGPKTITVKNTNDPTASTPITETTTITAKLAKKLPFTTTGTNTVSIEQYGNSVTAVPNAVADSTEGKTDAEVKEFINNLATTLGIDENEAGNVKISSTDGETVTLTFTGNINKTLSGNLAVK